MDSGVKVGANTVGEGASVVSAIRAFCQGPVLLMLPVLALFRGYLLRRPLSSSIPGFKLGRMRPAHTDSPISCRP